MPNEHQDENDIFKNEDANSGSQTDADYSADDTENSEESNDELRDRLAKLEENYKNQKIRAEKAESELKKKAPAERGGASKPSDLTARDIIAVTQAGINEEDLDEVIEYAKFKRIPVSEAIKSPIVKNLIKEKDEYRRSAQAANTGSSRKGSMKASDNMLLDNAKKGIVPSSDEEMRRLIELRGKR